MKKEEWNEGLNHLDSDLVEEYVSEKEKLTQKNKMSRRFWSRMGAVAACLVLVIGAVIVLQDDGPGLPPSILGPTTPSVPTEPTSPPRPPRPLAPIWEGAIYSAEEMAKMFNNQTLGVETSHYIKVSVSNPNALNIPPIPETEYLEVYRRGDGFEADEAELRTFFDSYLPKVADALGLEGMAIPSYKTHIMPIGNPDDGYINYVSAGVNMGDYSMNCRQDAVKTEISLTNEYSKNHKEIYLDGKPVKIHINQSAEDILASLENIKNTLFDIFGVSFPNVKIVQGSTYAVVYFYDKSAEPFDFAISDLEKQTPVTECIKIAVYYDSILSGTHITYTQMRGDLLGEYECFARAKMISLEKAEELLYKGYVFGGHQCPICMGQQTGVDFEGYDFVGMEYLVGYDRATAHPTTIMPFYVFYKKIGEENGNHIYAKTYVSAVEVSGYEDYFKS